MDNKTSSLKRVNDSTTENKRQRPKLNQSPRIPVRTTIASRSKKVSPTISTSTSLTRKPPVPKRIVKSSKVTDTEAPMTSNSTPQVEASTSTATTTEMGRSQDPVKKLSLGSNTLTSSPAKKLSLGSNTPTKRLSLGSNTPTKKLSLGSTMTPLKKKLSLGSAATTKRLSMNGNTTSSTPLRPLGSSRFSNADKTTVKRPATITHGVTKKAPARMPKFPGDIKGKLNYLQSQLEITGEQGKI